MKKERIWELDAFRGLCILGMVVVHFVYDLRELYHLADFPLPTFFLLVMNWGGVLFFLLSGICVTLGSHPVKRGLLVFAAGMVCTLVTFGLYALGMAGDGVLIRFGVLHCLGICMLLWPLCKKLPSWAIIGISAVVLALGYWFQTFTVSTSWLYSLGLVKEGFYSADFFPLLPNVGWFLLGAVLGRVLYKEKKTLFPKVPAEAFPIRFLSWCGRQSLFIYLLHQPVLTFIMELCLRLI